MYDGRLYTSKTGWLLDNYKYIYYYFDFIRSLFKITYFFNRNQAINMLHSKMNNYASKSNHSNPENNTLKSSNTRLFFENLITNNQANINQVNQVRPNVNYM